MSSLITLVRQWLQEASEQMQTPVTLPLGLLLGVPAALLVIWLIWHRHHQQALAAKAWLMNEAVRNEDLAFRLSARGLCKGERALLDSLNNMGHEIGILMDRHEVESWQKLTRVLTHEIMNATAPISCITQAWLADPRIKGSQYEEALKAIQETTASLSAFVESYRKMTQLQKPVPTDVNLQQVASTLQAMYPALTWHVHLDEAPTVFTDAHLLLQIMVNMAKNAAEAGAAHMGCTGTTACSSATTANPSPVMCAVRYSSPSSPPSVRAAASGCPSPDKSSWHREATSLCYPSQ